MLKTEILGDQEYRRPWLDLGRSATAEEENYTYI